MVYNWEIGFCWGNCDSLELGPFVSDSESGGDGTDWTAEAPAGCGGINAFL